MPAQPHILFCESPLEKNKVDPDFEEEFDCARKNNFTTLLFDFDNLIDASNAEAATRHIKPGDELTNVIYKGWMLTPLQYGFLYNSLLTKNYKLINNLTEYQNCHYLPDSLRFIESKTPKTIFEKLSDQNSIEKLIGKTKIFGNQPVIIKDYVKSEKHDWDTACFVDDASNIQKLNETVNNLIRLRGKYLNEGIVVRAFLELHDLTIHSKSGMPLKEEYRLFFFKKQLLGIYDYWEEGDYQLYKPDTAVFEEMAKCIESNFFSMDIARQKNGELIVIELGDGQVSGLPERIDKNEFYQKLNNHLKTDTN